jgi:hypothetical protein
VSSLKWGIVASIIALFLSVSLGIIAGVAPFYIFIRALIFSVVFFGLGLGMRILINHYFPELLYFEDEETQKEDDYEQGGQRINITLGGIGEYAVPEMYKPSPNEPELGNIEDLLSGYFKPPAQDIPADTYQVPRQEYRAPAPMPEFTPEPLPGMDMQEGIDRRTEEDYNGLQAESAREAPAPRAAAFTPSFGDDSDDLGALPDLGSMATAFSSASGGGPGAEWTPKDAEAFALETEPPSLDDVPVEAPTGGTKSGNKPQPLEGDFDPQEIAQGIRTILAKDHQ